SRLYSPIEIVSASFGTSNASLALTVHNRHCHRPLDTLELRVVGAVVDGANVTAAPGEMVELHLNVLADAARVEIAFWHPEGWMVDGYGWDVPGRTADPHVGVLAGAETPKLA